MEKSEEQKYIFAKEKERKKLVKEYAESVYCRVMERRKK